jgi:hypothetical protein
MKINRSFGRERSPMKLHWDGASQDNGSWPNWNLQATGSDAMIRNGGVVGQRSPILALVTVKTTEKVGNRQGALCRTL